MTKAKPRTRKAARSVAMFDSKGKMAAVIIGTRRSKTGDVVIINPFGCAGLNSGDGTSRHKD